MSTKSSSSAAASAAKVQNLKRKAKPASEGEEAKADKPKKSEGKKEQYFQKKFNSIKAVSAQQKYSTTLNDNRYGKSSIVHKSTVRDLANEMMADPNHKAQFGDPNGATKERKDGIKRISKGAINAMTQVFAKSLVDQDLQINRQCDQQKREARITLEGIVDAQYVSVVQCGYPMKPLDIMPIIDDHYAAKWDAYQKKMKNRVTKGKPNGMNNDTLREKLLRYTHDTNRIRRELVHIFGRTQNGAQVDMKSFLKDDGPFALALQIEADTDDYKIRMRAAREVALAEKERLLQKGAATEGDEKAPKRVRKSAANEEEEDKEEEKKSSKGKAKAKAAPAPKSGKKDKPAAAKPAKSGAAPKPKAKAAPAAKAKATKESKMRDEDEAEDAEEDEEEEEEEDSAEAAGEEDEEEEEEEGDEDEEEEEEDNEEQVVQ